jgi:hypothetical protein
MTNSSHLFLKLANISIIWSIWFRIFTLWYTLIRHNVDSLSSVILERSQVFSLRSVEKLLSPVIPLWLYLLTCASRMIVHIIICIFCLTAPSCRQSIFASFHSSIISISHPMLAIYFPSIRYCRYRYHLVLS